MSSRPAPKTSATSKLSDARTLDTHLLSAVLENPQLSVVRSLYCEGQSEGKLYRLITGDHSSANAFPSEAQILDCFSEYADTPSRISGEAEDRMLAF